MQQNLEPRAINLKTITLQHSFSRIPAPDRVSIAPAPGLRVWRRFLIVKIADNGIVEYLTDRMNLSEPVNILSARYQEAKPFPHLVLDNLFPTELLESLVAEIPPPKEENWVREDNERLLKFNLRSAVDLGNSGFQLTAFFALCRISVLSV